MRRSGPPRRDPASDADVSDSERRRSVSRIGLVKPESARAIARLGRILGHPLRVQILSSLARQPNSATGLVPVLEVPLSNISYHLNEILDRRYGVVEAVGTNYGRGSEETFYRVDPNALLAGLVWPEIPSTVSKGLLGASLVTLWEQALAALETGAMDARSHSTTRWRPVLLDEKGRREVHKALQQANDRVDAAASSSVERAAAVLSTVVVALATFEAAPASRYEAPAEPGESQ